MWGVEEMNVYKNCHEILDQTEMTKEDVAGNLTFYC